jgi:nucleoside-diphosphate-sugar epimerase
MMRIFVAGATGALGRRLVPTLVSAGHEVVGTTRSADKAATLAENGAEPVVLDALDRDAVVNAVTKAKPDVVVHELSDLARLGNPRKFAEDFAQTNRLRTRGLDYLLAAARTAGAHQFVAQSYAGWPNERTGGRVKTEDDPLDPNPPAPARETLDAIRYLESVVTQASDLEGIVLRYGTFYGPGTGLAEGGAMLEMVRKRRVSAGRRRHRCVVVRSYRRRRDGDACGDRAREAGNLQHRRRRARRRLGMAPVPGPSDRRRGTDADARLACSTAARRARDLYHDRNSWLVQRKGQARTRLDVAAPEVAGGLSHWPRLI